MSMNYSKPSMLITPSRSGSTWVHDCVKHHNKKYHNILSLYNGTTFLVSKCVFDFVGNNISDRIKWLESERKSGREYTYKFMLDENSIKHTDWFKDFYKDWNTIFLTRRNKFDHIVSRSVQLTNNWSQNRNDIITIPFSTFEACVCYYDNMKIDFADQAWYYEDCSDDNLHKYFGVDPQPLEKWESSNYEDTILNYDEVKEWYEHVLSTSLELN